MLLQKQTLVLIIKIKLTHKHLHSRSVCLCVVRVSILCVCYLFRKSICMYLWVCFVICVRFFRRFQPCPLCPYKFIFFFFAFFPFNQIVSYFFLFIKKCVVFMFMRPTGILYVHWTQCCVCVCVCFFNTYNLNFDNVFERIFI